MVRFGSVGVGGTLYIEKKHFVSYYAEYYFSLGTQEGGYANAFIGSIACSGIFTLHDYDLANVAYPGSRHRRHPAFDSSSSASLSYRLFLTSFSPSSQHF